MMNRAMLKGSARRRLAPVVVLTLSFLVLPSSSIEQCSVCDDKELRKRCLKEFPGRKVCLRDLASKVHRIFGNRPVFDRSHGPWRACVANTDTLEFQDGKDMPVQTLKS